MGRWTDDQAEAISQCAAAWLKNKKSHRAEDYAQEAILRLLKSDAIDIPAENNEKMRAIFRTACHFVRCDEIRKRIGREGCIRGREVNEADTQTTPDVDIGPLDAAIGGTVDHAPVVHDVRHDLLAAIEEEHARPRAVLRALIDDPCTAACAETCGIARGTVYAIMSEVRHRWRTPDSFLRLAGYGVRRDDKEVVL